MKYRGGLLAAVFLVAMGAGAVAPPGEQDRVIELLESRVAGIATAARHLSSPQASARLKEVSAHLIGRHGSAGDDRHLLAAARDSAPQVRQAALIALQKLLDPVNRHVPLRVRDREVLEPPQTPPALDSRWPALLCGLLGDDSHLIRAGAAQTLGLLGSTACLKELRRLVGEDPMDPVRFWAAQAVEQLTAQAQDYVNGSHVAEFRPPLVTIFASGRARAQLTPLVRAAWFNGQAKFTMPGGMPAHRQTRAEIWWSPEALHLEAVCDDPGGGDDQEDSLRLFLQAADEGRVHQFELKSGSSQVLWSVPGSEPREEESSQLSAQTIRGPDSWTARLSIPFAALGRPVPVEGELWLANLIRQEVHVEGRAEVSSWTYHHKDQAGSPPLGHWRFAHNGPYPSFRPPPENIFVYSFDDYSPAQDRHRPIDPASETVWGRMIPPDGLRPGLNQLSFLLPGSGQRLVSLKATARGDRGRANVQAEGLPSGEDGRVTVALDLSSLAEARSVDIELELLDNETGRHWFREVWRAVPLVTPPRAIRSDDLKMVEGPGPLWTPEPSPVQWRIQDLGPMLLAESYPMCLVEGQGGRLYGGTYPGGRLFSFDPVAGVVQDLGSPSPPHNHLHDLVASPQGRLYGGLYRPQGRLFSFDPASGTTTDMGVPVPGGFSGTCKVSAWAGGRVYGTQRGHLFWADERSGRVTNKGSFQLGGKRYVPTSVVADEKGHLLGVAGGQFFRYLPDQDEVRIADFGFHPRGNAGREGGWFLPGPDGFLYLLFDDGRLFRWEAEAGRLVLSARYAPVAPGPGVSVVLTPGRELVVGRSGIMEAEENRLLVYRPRGGAPLDLGNPISGHLYLTALTLARSGVVYGVSTYRGYSLERTPIHIYALFREEPTSSKRN